MGLDSTLAHLKNSYMIIPLAVLVVMALMKFDETLSGEEKPTSDYIKGILVTILLSFFFLYIHAIDESTFEVGKVGIPTF